MDYVDAGAGARGFPVGRRSNATLKTLDAVLISAHRAGAFAESSTHPDAVSAPSRTRRRVMSCVLPAVDDLEVYGQRHC